MSGDNPGTNITLAGDWSKPANTLIEKICSALGGYFEPHQIRRIAHAKADAEKIAATAAIEVTELQQRALRRFVAEETKKQDNMEAITAKALPQIGENAKTENVEDDWITNFFDKCRLISDQDMQVLWAKVLAGEANSPGLYSKRTVDFLGSLDKSDAGHFSALCGFCWMLNGLTPLIYDPQGYIYNAHNINFNTLTHLDDIGLVSFQPIASFRLEKLPQLFLAHYYGTPFIVHLEHMHGCDIGNVLLTSTGKELAPICDSKRIPGFLEFVLERWTSNGLVVSSPYPQQGNYPNE